MNEHSVQVVISKPGDRQIQLRLQGATPDREMVLRISSDGCSAPDAIRVSSGDSKVSLELRWSEPAPAVEPSPQPAPESQAPLANAWALAQRLRERQGASRPRPRVVRSRSH